VRLPFVGRREETMSGAIGRRSPRLRRPALAVALVCGAAIVVAAGSGAAPSLVASCSRTDPMDALEQAFPPADLRLNAYESDACIYVFAEKQNYTLGQDFNPKAPSTTNVLTGPNRRIPTGTVVDSYLLHADRIGQPSTGSCCRASGRSRSRFSASS
jgi:hypothetical protein